MIAISRWNLLVFSRRLLLRTHTNVPRRSGDSCFSATLTSRPNVRHQATWTRHSDVRCFSETLGGSGSSDVCRRTDTEQGTRDTHSDVTDDSGVNQRASGTFTLDLLVSLLRQENASDICVIRVPEQLAYVRYLVVVSGMSPRHLRAMAQYAVKVYKFLRAEDSRHVKVEGKDDHQWMCIDFGNMVVHFMLPEARDRYELEKLWTLHSYDEQLRKIPAETLPQDFVYDLEDRKWQSTADAGTASRSCLSS